MNSWTADSASRIRDVWTGGCVSASIRKYSQQAVRGVEGGCRPARRTAAEPDGQVGGQDPVLIVTMLPDDPVTIVPGAIWRPG